MLRRLLGAAALAALTISVLSYLTFPSTAGAAPSGDKEVRETALQFTRWLALSPVAQNITPAVATGSVLDTDTATLTDTATAGSGTATSFAAYSFLAPTLAASNTLVTTSDAATLYVSAAPIAGTNETFTRSYALWVDAGKAKFDGDFECDGDMSFDGAVTLGDAATDDITITGSLAADLVAKTGLSGGFDFSVAAGAADTAGSSFDLTGAAGGAAGTDQVGKNGGVLSLTGGAGSAKNGAGATDGDGADVVLLGGALGGTTGGTEVNGIVRVGSPTVGSTKATNLLACGGGLEVDGAARFDGAVTLGDAAADGVVVQGTPSLRNVATGSVTLDYRDYGDTTDDDMAHALVTVNCTDTGTGAEDCDYSVGVVEAGAAAETRFSIDADGDITIGSATNAGVVSLGTSTSLRNSATGNVVQDYRDYADSADDDMAHAEVLVNCTDATTGAEDCDYSIGVVEAGAANEVRFSIDADGDVTVGSANNAKVVSLGTGTELRNSATGNVDLDWRDYADSDDDDMAHATARVNCTDTGTGAEDCDWSLLVVEAGAAGEARLSFDADGDNTWGSANSDNNVCLSAEFQLRNNATGNVDMSFRDYADSADDDMAHVILRANLSDATTGAEDADFSILVSEAGAAPVQQFLIDGDAGIVIGSATNASVELATTGTGDAAVVLPAGSVSGTEILDGTINAEDEAFAGRGQIVICGTLDTIASNTVYYGPNTAVTATAIGGMTCDTGATGNVTEATADAPAFTAKAFHVRGMVCRNADTNVTEVTYTLRSAEAGLTPAVSCSVGDGVLDCVADAQTTTAVASGATFAVAASEADEAVGAVVFVCVIDIAY